MFDLIYRFDPAARNPDGSPANAPATAAEAARRLMDGNKEFSRLLDMYTTSDHEQVVIPFDANALGLPTADGKAPTQQPYAAILGCSDARVPTEMIFNQACNDLFVVRVAGNGLGVEVLGSLDYAVTNLGSSLKLVVVLGHSGCGAVTAAADAFMHPARYLKFSSSHPLRAIIDRTFPAVRAAHAGLEEVYGQDVETAPGYATALTETAVALNAAVTAAALRDELKEQLGPDRKVMYGVYNLVTRRVKMALEPDDGVAIRLASPPDGPDGFERLAVLVAGSGMVRGMLGR